MRGWGVPVERWGTDELRRRVPWGKFDDVRAGIGSASDGVVTPSTMTEIYAEAARRHGVDFRLGAPFGSLRRTGGSWEVAVSGTTLHARQLVVARGLDEVAPYAARPPGPARSVPDAGSGAPTCATERGGLPFRPRHRPRRLRPARVERSDPGRRRDGTSRGRPRTVLTGRRRAVRHAPRRELRLPLPGLGGRRARPGVGGSVRLDARPEAAGRSGARRGVALRGRGVQRVRRDASGRGRPASRGRPLGRRRPLPGARPPSAGPSLSVRGTRRTVPAPTRIHARGRR